MNTNAYKFPIILSIDTSCDETSSAVTRDLIVLSSVVWSQSKIHAKFGGVVPSTARREHERRISWVVKRAIKTANISYSKIDAFSVTVGPGLAIALGVGINFAKDLAMKYKKPLISVNHLEGHVLSPLARVKNFQFSNSNFQLKTKAKNIQVPICPSDDRGSNLQIPEFPAFGIVVSGGNTLLVYIEKIGKYKVLAQTIDDALGESLDKSARLLGLGYPGGAILEKFARLHNVPFDFAQDKSARQAKINPYTLPIPMLGRESEGQYSYSGLKTAFYRIVEDLKQKGELSLRVKPPVRTSGAEAPLVRSRTSWFGEDPPGRRPSGFKFLNTLGKIFFCFVQETSTVIKSTSSGNTTCMAFVRSITTTLVSLRSFHASSP